MAEPALLPPGMSHGADEELGLTQHAADEGAADEGAADAARDRPHRGSAGDMARQLSQTREPEAAQRGGAFANGAAPEQRIGVGGGASWKAAAAAKDVGATTMALS